MKIRKLYRIESAHIVKGAVSQRCSNSYHGHSGVIEVFLTSNGLDDAGMVYDFGAFKNTIGSFIDMFDHSVHLSKESVESLVFFTCANSRYVILPCNPTAENYAILFRDCINEILQNVTYTNGEQNVVCTGVRYHETVTGYAESDNNDAKLYSLSRLEFSKDTLNEASNEIKEIIKKVKGNVN